MTATPQSVLDALDKLSDGDKSKVQSYIDELKTTIKDQEKEIKTLKGEDVGEDDVDADMAADEGTNDGCGCAGHATTSTDDDDDGVPFPPVYAGSSEDYDKAGDAKQEAADMKSNGDWDGALAKYTEAVLAAPPSALLYANRATALLKLGRLKAAERDCTLALEQNPDSAKALRVRGKVRKELGKFEEALADLSASQAIDFDEGTVEDLKFLTEQHLAKEKAEAEKRNTEKEKLKKRAEEIKKAQEEAKREAAKEKASGSGGAGGMPFGGMPGGFPGGMPGAGGMGGMGMPPGMEGLMNDPELLASLQNPKVQAALGELMSGPGGPMGLMSNPAKLQELMSDPEVGPVLQKLMSKMMAGGGMPGMGGMPGAGAGGMPGAGGAGAFNNDDNDDIPDLEEIN